MIKDIYKLKKITSNPIVGIYFLWDCDNLVYIGQSTDIYKRISEHRNIKKFTHFNFIECPEHKLNTLEKSYIQTYNPILNKTFSKQISIIEEIKNIVLLEDEFKIVNNIALFKQEDKIIQIPLIKIKKNLQFVGFKGLLKPNVFTPNTLYGNLFYNGVEHFIVYDKIRNIHTITQIK